MFGYPWIQNIGVIPFGGLTMSSRAGFFMGMAMATAAPSFGYATYRHCGYIPIVANYVNPFSFCFNPYASGLMTLPSRNSFSPIEYSMNFIAAATNQNPIQIGVENLYQQLKQIIDNTANNRTFELAATAYNTMNNSNNTNTEYNTSTDNTSTDNTSADNTNDNIVTNPSNTPSDLKPGLFKGRLSGQEALVSRICRKYNVPVDVIASIIGLESGWGTSNLAYHNNFGGYRAAGDLGANAKGFGYFSTIEKGLEGMIRNIANYPKRYSDVKAVDWNNIDAIARHYCNSGWAAKVRTMYNSNVKRYLA